jgi:hypothetical protein
VPRDPLSPTPAAGVTIDRSGRCVGAARLRALVAELLDASKLCAIATASRTAKPHVNTAYFAWTAGAPADDAAAVYERRFPPYRPEQLGAYRCYELRPRRVKLFHEPALGPGVFVTARVDQKGAVIWERTEVYRK